MAVPKVERAHIVPRTYLRNFADVEGMIGMRLVTSRSGEKVISINDAGVRKRFYRRTTTDGSDVDDIEPTLGAIEDAAAPILRTIEERWPLELKAKTTLAELFATQLLRGPRWRAAYERRTKRLVQDYRERKLFAREIEASGLTVDEVAERNREAFLSDTMRLRRMLEMVANGSAIFGSMIWGLLQFRSPVIVTCDQPVVGWPQAEFSLRPAPIRDGIGLLNFLEVRVPVSPTAAILMAWLDEPGDVGEPIPGARHHARNINAFTVAQADKQWFHFPGAKPPVGTGRYRPLAPEVHREYDSEAMARCFVHHEISRRVNERLGSGSDEYEIVRVEPPTPRPIIGINGK